MSRKNEIDLDKCNKDKSKKKLFTKNSYFSIFLNFFSKPTIKPEPFKKEPALPHTTPPLRPVRNQWGGGGPLCVNYVQQSKALASHGYLEMARRIVWLITVFGFLEMNHIYLRPIHIAFKNG